VSWDALAVRLTRHAETLAKARGELRARRADPQRWRKARLLWPLFTTRNG